jgi:tetrahydromethanopterin S-methyltransferase subunit G
MRKLLVIVSLIILATPCLVQAQDDYSSLMRRIRNLESKVSHLESKVMVQEFDIRRVREKLDDAAIVLFFFAVFCALWAQNTDRNPWLWFFLGLFFHVVTALVLLFKNAVDRRAKNELRKIS